MMKSLLTLFGILLTALIWWAAIAVTDELNQNVVKINDLTQQTAEMAEATKNASDEAKDLMLAASKSLEQFKV